MILTNMVLTPGPLLRTIFEIFLYVLNIPLLAFFPSEVLAPTGFYSKGYLTSFNIFVLKLKFVIFHPNFKISFIVSFHIVLIFSHRVSNRCTLYYIIKRRAPIGDIQHPLILVAGIQILAPLFSTSMVESP